jgi:hypothetical protein
MSLLPRSTILLLLGVLAALPAAAQETSTPGGVTLGPTLGTLGAGGELGYRAGPYLGVRLDVSYLHFPYDRSIEGIPYRFGVNLLSGGPVLDVYPFAGGFHLTAGARLNDNRASISSTPPSNVTINGDTFTPAQLGTLSGSLKYNRVAPYLGIGYSARVTNWLELGLDAGVLYQGKPHVSLAANGASAMDPTLQTDLAQEERTIENHLSFTTWYPALTFALLFHF